LSGKPLTLLYETLRGKRSYAEGFTGSPVAHGEPVRWAALPT